MSLKVLERYVRPSLTGVSERKKQFSLVGNTDADMASDLDNRKSTRDFCTFD